MTNPLNHHPHKQSSALCYLHEKDQPYTNSNSTKPSLYNQLTPKTVIPACFQRESSTPIHHLKS